jgi:hypothetical protein
MFWYIGFNLHYRAIGVEEDSRSKGEAERLAFYGNAGFGCGLVLLTVVIVLMGLKEDAVMLLFGL